MRKKIDFFQKRGGPIKKFVKLNYNSKISRVFLGGLLFTGLKIWEHLKPIGPII